MKIERIGNIELRAYNEGKFISGEIVRYHPNPCYGDKKKSTCNIKELCYTVAFVEGCRGEEPDIKTVGSRPFISSDKDTNDFVEVCKLVYKEYWKSNNDEEE